jgi:hypothetical protein
MMRLPHGHRVLVVTLAMATTPVPVVGQEAEAPYLTPGARIRVWSPELSYGVLVGRLWAFYADSFTVLAEGRLQGLSYVPLQRFDVSRGRHPAVILGPAAVGAGIGALLGPALITEDQRCDVVDDPQCGSETPDALIGAAVGGIAFAVLARLVAGERWVEIPLARLRLGLETRAARRSLTLGLALPLR